MSNTSSFYVVDADAEVLETFKFKYKPPEYDADYVHIWNAKNPATGLAYGYGGVKLFNKKMFTEIKTALDFSTTLAKGIKIMDEVACITRFNSDPFRAYRGAFREAVKLYRTANSEELSIDIKNEAKLRIEAWLNPLPDCDYRDYIIRGFQTGLLEAQNRKDDRELQFINDHDLIFSLAVSQYPEIDISTNPKPGDDHPMKHEFFFTTRVAAIMYDDYVLENLKITELRDAISDGQLLSKNWLVDEFTKLRHAGKFNFLNCEQPRVVILGGWIGTLALMFAAWEIPMEITSVDLDWRCNAIAEKLNYDQNFKTLTMDMYNVDYSQFDIIINTSSEHIHDIPRWRSGIPSDKILIVQNNDFESGEGHVSTVKNSNQLRKALNLSDVFYEGTRTFHSYSRFMLIGKT